MCYLLFKFKLQFNVYVVCSLNFNFRLNYRLPVYKIYPAVNHMCYVFVIFYFAAYYLELTCKIFFFGQTCNKSAIETVCCIHKCYLQMHQFFCSPSPDVFWKSLNIVKPQYTCWLRQQLTPLKTLELLSPITGYHQHHWMANYTY